MSSTTEITGAPRLPIDEDQRRLIRHELDRNVVVEAAAGTGKTTSMVERMVALLGSGRCAAVSHLAAVTFTRKAAAELRSRFQAALEQAAREASGPAQGRLLAALAHLEQGFVGTIHSFCGRLLRERPVEAGVDLAFLELDQDADERLREEVWESFVLRELGAEGQRLQGELDRRGLSLRELRAAFLCFADYPDVARWPCPTAAELPDLGPIVARIDEYVAHMRQLAPLLPEDAGNDTLIPAYRELPRMVEHHRPLDPRAPRQVLDVLRLFGPKSFLVTRWVREGKLSKTQAQEERDRYEQWREEIVLPTQRAWYEHCYGPVLEVLQRARERYDERRAQRGQLNFQDLLLRAARLLAERAHVRRYFAERYTHLLVDEFQDTDPLQAEMLLQLTAIEPADRDWRRCQPRPGALFVVGDPKQSIYRFRRADIVTYNQVKQIILEGGGRVVELSANFRTTAPVIEWVNGVFRPLFPEQVSDEAPSYVPLACGRDDSQLGELSGVRVLQIPEEPSRANSQTVQLEAEWIARCIRDALDRGLTVTRSRKERTAGRAPQARPDDFLIVTMQRSHLSAYALKLQEHGIAHRVSGGAALNEVEELRLLHLGLQAATRPHDPVALLAALRSELWGISDAALYAFRRAEGRFCYEAEIPEALASPHAEALADAFRRLKHYQHLLVTLSRPVALARIVDDLGLLALAAAREGGEVQAGSLAKALELLRTGQRGSWSTRQLLVQLERMVLHEEVYDGLSALSDEQPAVRVMNLHKAKGLEAPVVFLADPTGEHRRAVSVHVDRAGPQVCGYLLIEGERHGHSPAPRLAQPAGWEALARREERFLAAEGVRKLYVAATRAGSLLVVTQRAQQQHRNPWAPFAAALEGAPALAMPEVSARASLTGEELARDAVGEELARDAIGERLRALALRRTALCQATYRTSAAKRYAFARRGSLAAVEPTADELASSDEEHGAEWGTLIHQLLQAAMLDPERDLSRLATLLLVEQELEAELAEEAIAMVRAVMRSPLWQRARAARRRLVEVPFQVLEEQGSTQRAWIPQLVRGVIDLAFQEEDGWVLVDYKTDARESRERHAPQLELYASAWYQSTGERPKERGLFFTRTGSYVVL